MMMMKRRRNSLRMMTDQQQLLEQQQQQAQEAHIVRNIARSVEDYANGLTRDAKFLNETEIESSVAVFHSSEIALGKLLGKGGFSQVYEAAAFNLMQTQPSSAASQMNLARRIVEGTAIDYKGEATYALKHLDKKLLQNPDEFCAAAADLYVEAKYMSRFNHPNILKLRGMANGGTSAFHEGRHNSFFILTDRLSDTLDDRIVRWNRQAGGNPTNNAASLMVKTNYALQMASALEYLHERRIIFRDLKPQNIGFKSDDVVQLFDFGLCRELPTSNGYDPEEVFKMSEAGTKRYMAVEVHINAHYNLKADCYSWAAVFYEMLSMEKPYARISDMEFQTLVLGQGLRPGVAHLQLPANIEQTIQEAWTQHYAQRPSMKEIRMRLESIVGQWERMQQAQAQAQAQQQQRQTQVFPAMPVPITPPMQTANRIMEEPMFFRATAAAPPPQQPPARTNSGFSDGMGGSSPLLFECKAPSPPPTVHLSQQAAPVFTFDLTTEQQPQLPPNLKRQTTSAEVTLTTENSTAYWDDDLSISTFDYSLSSLMELDRTQRAAQQAQVQNLGVPTLEVGPFRFT